jgi:hypothetical protein
MEVPRVYVIREQERSDWQRATNQRATNRLALQVQESIWACQAKRRKEPDQDAGHPRAHSAGAHLLERVKIPSFNGEVEDWAEF